MTKILILYASKHGSTAEVAAYLADIFRKNDIAVDVTNAAEFDKDVLNYDAIVIGTGIYHGMWLNPLWNAVRRLNGQLANIPVWGFALCVRILEEDGAAHIQKHYLPHKVLDKINLQDFKFFAGRVTELSPNELASFAERYDGDFVNRRGDYRDWDAIHHYGKAIAKALNAVKA